MQIFGLGISFVSLRKEFHGYLLYIPLKYNQRPSSCRRCPSQLLLPMPCLPQSSTVHKQGKLMVEEDSRFRDRKWGQD